MTPSTLPPPAAPDTLPTLPMTESDPGRATTVCQACQGQGLVLATDPKDGMAVCFVCLGQGATS